MSIAVSIVSYRPGKEQETKDFLKQYDEIEVYGSDEDTERILILTDMDSKALEDLCKELAKNDDIISVLQHSFYFGDEEEGKENQ